jgi:hypothetical protein
MDDGCKAMPQEQNASIEQGEFNAQAFSEGLLSLHQVWSSGWMTQVSRLNAEISEKSKRREVLNKRRASAGLLLKNLTASAVAIGFFGSILVISHAAAQALLLSAEGYTPGIASVLKSIEALVGQEVVTMVGTVTIAVVLIFLTEVLHLRETCVISHKDEQPDAKTFADLLKPKSNHIHFGNLQVGYQVTETDGKLVVRSLGDQFVAVFSRSLLGKAELGVQAAYDGWRGEHNTPPVVIPISGAGADSSLVIHGAHFEAPGMDETTASEQAKLFLRQLGRNAR